MKTESANSIKFYILIPVYKTERYIRRCLDSVCRQTYPNFEVVIVDDGTPDKAGEICDAYAAKDSRFHVIHKENQGLISARRVGIGYVKEYCDETNGYFVFLDSDDALCDHTLSTLRDVIEARKCDVVVYELGRVKPGENVASLKQKTFTGIVEDKRELYNRVFADAAYNPLCRKAISCALLHDDDYSSFYHISSAEDLLQSIPVYADCRRVVFIDDVLYQYTINPESITQTVPFTIKSFDPAVRAEVWKFIQQQTVQTPEDKQGYLARCRAMLEGRLLAVGNAKVSFGESCRVFDYIRGDSYYAQLLATAAPKDRVLRWLNKGRYRTLVGWAKLRAGLSRLKRFLG